MERVDNIVLGARASFGVDSSPIAEMSETLHNCTSESLGGELPSSTSINPPAATVNELSAAAAPPSASNNISPAIRSENEARHLRTNESSDCINSTAIEMPPLETINEIPSDALTAASNNVPSVGASALVSSEIAALDFQHKSKDKGGAGRKRNRATGAEKIELVLNNVDAIGAVQSLLGNCASYLDAIRGKVGGNDSPSGASPLDWDQLLAVLQFCQTTLSGQTSQIRNALNNTTEKKSASQAHAILSRGRNNELKHKQQVTAMLLRVNPSKMLQESLLEAQQRVVTISTGGKNCAVGEGSLPKLDSIQSRQKRQRVESAVQNEERVEGAGRNDEQAESAVQRGEQVDDVGRNEEPAEGAVQNEGEQLMQIGLPPPKDGLMYHPNEAVTIYYDITQKVEELSGSKKKNIQRSYLKHVKDMMIQRCLVPVQLTRLNVLFKKHGAPGQPSPNPIWDQNGRKPYLDVDELAKKFNEQQQSRRAEGWSKANTKKLLFDAKKKIAESKKIDPRTVKEPDEKTVNAYHYAIGSLANVSQRKAQSKSVHREVAETSQRAMLSNAAGIITSMFRIDEHNTTPLHMKFDESRASEGAKKAREIYAEAAGVPKECVQPNPRELLSSIDDMAAMYDSSAQGVTSNNEGEELVLVDTSLVDANRSYGVHKNTAPTKSFNGIKCRPTTYIFGSGRMGALWIQYPGFTEAEIPKDKVPNGVIVIPVKGLAPNGNLSVHSEDVGHVVLMRGENGTEQTMFRLFEELVRVPTVDKQREAMGISTTDVPDHGIAVTTLDGGMTQLAATEHYLQSKVGRKEVQTELAKNTSAVASPCDHGKGHFRRRHWTKKLTSNQIPSIGVTQNLEQSLNRLSAEGKLIIAAGKRNNIVSCTARCPSAVHLAYNERSTAEAFVLTGMLDESLQAPDIFTLFGQLKRSYTTTESAKWLTDMPTIVKEFLQYGHVRENDQDDTFAVLGYPVDTDSSGNEHQLSRAFATQHHRQRCTIMTSDHVQSALAQKHGNQAAIARENAEQDRIAEKRWREEVLHLNATFEDSLVANLEGCGTRSDLESAEIFPLELPKMLGKYVAAFVMARSLKSSDRKFQKSMNFGSPENVLKTIERMEANDSYQLDPKKDLTFYYKAFLLRNSPVILTINDDDNTNTSTEEPAAAAAAVDSESAVSQNIIVEASNGMAVDKVRRSLFLNNISLLSEVRACLYGCALNEIIPQSMKSQIESLTSKIPHRLHHRMQTQIQDSYLHSHWALEAFKDNIHQLCQIIGMAGHINKNIASITGLVHSLLRQPSQGCYAKVDIDANNCKSKQGVGLYYDQESALFCHVGSVHGKKENTLGSRYDEDKKNSEKADTFFAQKYPSKQPRNAQWGGWSGTFGDLVFYAPIAFDPNAENDCLFRKEGGLFVWSEATLNKLGESKVSDDLKTKQLMFISCMFEFMYSLMMDATKSIPVKAFRPFTPVGV
eukprot:scaffold17562_cov140-Skeletonema_dohrnii-CCMP3373.AAC.3